ncbi:CRISPR system precrRNA processing endoribonuclease RAMP protein Cas6 [Sulfurovum sp.]|uniref:CRISPR system precrRNA processing endoribonuclease RAMP protein Cas6 n=1 Tax=Sulfurovum sp. TaxID=1969726 RepID=UPI0025D0C05E|nr:CRISPR system precrRNA processing endoribonuclease RAMP protein Cas6 [Sulfurovum sp.]
MKYSKLTFTLKDTPKPHFFIGSKMRGMLGYALKDEVCINPTFKCEGCFYAGECAFYEMYEKENATHKYRLDFKLHSSKYKFSLLLFGALMKSEKMIEKSMNKALNSPSLVVKSKQKEVKEKKDIPKVLKLTFLTPLRIKKNNRFARNDIELIDILRSIYKRERDMRDEPIVPLKIKQDYKMVMKSLKYQEITRKSNKQQRHMNMGGLMGEMILSNVDAEVYRLLKLGEVLGVGKATVFGLGKIKIEEIG